MRITENRLLEKVGCSKNTLLQYLCRDDFMHIVRNKAKKHYVYYNVYEEDINELYNLVHKCGNHRKKYCTEINYVTTRIKNPLDRLKVK